MSEAGNSLRRAREAKNLTLADAEKATRIKGRYLQALEEGRWEDLPGLVQARGFMKNYATWLGLDGDALLASGVQARGPAPAPSVAAGRQPAFPLRPPTSQALSVADPALRPPERPLAPPASGSALPVPGPASPVPDELAGTPAWLSLDMVAGGIALVLFVVVALLAVRAYVIPLVSRLRMPVSAPTRAASIQATPVPTPLITPTLAFPVNPSGGIQIGLIATEHTWARVTTDGMTAFEGMFNPGQPLAWEAREQLIVETGNGAALNLVVNGKTMGPLGPRDKVTIRAWSPSGEVSPPPTPTPGPATVTPEPAPTLAPTSSL